MVEDNKVNVLDVGDVLPARFPSSIYHYSFRNRKRNIFNYKILAGEYIGID